MGIGSLSTATPTSGQPGSTGQTELVALKAAILASFPAFTPGSDICTLTGAQVDDAALKSATQTISGAWNFATAPTIGGVAVTTGARGFASLYFGTTGSVTFPLIGSLATLTGGVDSCTPSNVTTSPSAGTITITVTGTYRIVVDMGFVRGTGTSSFYSAVYNGASPISELVRQATPNSGAGEVVSSHMIRQLTAGDVLTVRYYGAAGTDTGTLANCHLSVEKVV